MIECKHGLGEFIKSKRAEKDLSLRELAEKTGISHSYLHNLENGIDPRTRKPLSPTLVTLEKLALGLDVPLETIIDIEKSMHIDHMFPLSPQAHQFKTNNIRMIPVLRTIATEGYLLADNLIDEWWPLDISILRTKKTHLNDYYYLRIHGDSMEPLFNDQDTVLVRQGPVDEGEIAVVLCNGENACVKKIQYLKDQELLMLISRNPAYPPVTKAMSECEVLGKVILRIGEPRW